MLDTFQQVTIYETPVLREETERRMHGRTFMLGFTYALGGTTQRQPRREQGFEFDTDTDMGDGM